MRRGEGSSCGKGGRGAPSPGGNVHPDLWKVSHPWDGFVGIFCGWKYLCMQQAVSLSLGVEEPSNIRGAAPGCGDHGQGRGLFWGTGGTACKGRTSVSEADGFGGRGEVDLKAFLNQGEMSCIPSVSAAMGIGWAKRQIPQMLCPAQQWPEPATSKIGHS